MNLLKHLLIFTMTFSLALSSDAFFGNSIPSSKQAIDFSVSKKGNNCFINFILLEDVYVYKNKLKILKDSEEITFKIIGKTIIQKDKFFGEQEILNENFVISFKSFDYVSKEQIQLEYQGCFANKICFNKETKKISL